MSRLSLVAVGALALFGQTPLAQSSCPHVDGVFQDMHDGDQKHVVVSGANLTITPHGNNETWVIDAPFDDVHCTAQVNFDVPGKPSPPPVPLLLSVWSLSSVTASPKVGLQFTDPSSTIAPSPTQPLNMWVLLSGSDR